MIRFYISCQLVNTSKMKRWLIMIWVRGSIKRRNNMLTIAIVVRANMEAPVFIRVRENCGPIQLDQRYVWSQLMYYEDISQDGIYI